MARRMCPEFSVKSLQLLHLGRSSRCSTSKSGPSVTKPSRADSIQREVEARLHPVARRRTTKLGCKTGQSDCENSLRARSGWSQSRGRTAITALLTARHDDPKSPLQVG